MHYFAFLYKQGQNCTHHLQKVLCGCKNEKRLLLLKLSKESSGNLRVLVTNKWNLLPGAL
jgi:hypothetical protein